MKPHEIDLESLYSWLEEETVMFASSTRERKRLECTLNGTLIVKVAGVAVWRGTQPFEAVERYNSITEPYRNPNRNFVL